MKVALLGDIHANDAALQAVLRAADEERVDAFLVTGDLVGYYFRPARVLEMLAAIDRPVHTVRGNHEDMLQARHDGTVQAARIRAKYGSGLDVAEDELSVAQRAGLLALPHPLQLRIGGREVLLSHGAPHALDQYVYPDADANTLRECAQPGFDLVVMGHTHYPFAKTVGPAILVNPGSVGQPRNGASGACWALYDTETGEAALRVARYDASALVDECRRRHPELPYLWEVLLRS